MGIITSITPMVGKYFGSSKGGQIQYGLVLTCIGTIWHPEHQTQHSNICWTSLPVFQGPTANMLEFVRYFVNLHSRLIRSFRVARLGGDLLFLRRAPRATSPAGFERFSSIFKGFRSGFMSASLKMRKISLIFWAHLFLFGAVSLENKGCKRSPANPDRQKSS